MAVIAYSGKGAHIVKHNDDLGETLINNRRNSTIEMPEVRELFLEILDTAGWSKYKTKFAKYGIKSTKHLNDIVEEDLEELG